MPARHPLDRSRSLHPELAERSRALRVWCSPNFHNTIILFQYRETTMACRTWPVKSSDFSTRPRSLAVWVSAVSMSLGQATDYSV